ncbi:adenosine receptor A3-like [Orbicella faveolata]|uniref:adenosine receptor A3-like n=1 Tax=Orbicella faveolata TaxID=48498 RepID=UPI0009E4D00B|nr:adenosine receptor A3-like [Orbicella faveolata]
MATVATENFAECSPTNSSRIHGHLIFLSASNIFLSLTAFLGNTLILTALRGESSLHPPTKLLFRSLATTDLCVGLVTEPLDVSAWMSMMNKRWNVCRYSSDATFIAGSVLCGVSLLSVTAVSVDRLLALSLGLRYRQVVALKRTYLVVITFWVVSIFYATSWFWNRLIFTWLKTIVILLCLTASIVSYTKIFFCLRHQQTQIQGHVPQEQQRNAIPLNILRYKKAVSSAIWVQLTLVACYLPYGIVSILYSKSQISSSSFVASQYAATLIYLNSSLNPILYCWKIREVRQAVKDTIRQFLLLFIKL